MGSFAAFGSMDSDCSRLSGIANLKIQKIVTLRLLKELTLVAILKKQRK